MFPIILCLKYIILSPVGKIREHALSIGAKKITSVATALSNILSVLVMLKKQTPLKGAFDTISF